MKRFSVALLGCTLITLFCVSAVCAQNPVYYAGHYVQQYNRPIDLTYAGLEALVCPTPSPTILPYGVAETSNSTLVIYRMTTVPASWPTSNLLLNCFVWYKGFMQDDILDVYGTRWLAPNLVNPNPSFTIRIPDSSFVSTFDSNRLPIAGAPVRIICDGKAMAEDYTNGRGMTEFAIPTGDQISAMTIINGWLYSSATVSSNTPQDIRFDATSDSVVKVKRGGTPLANYPVAVVDEDVTTILSLNSFLNENNGVFTTNAAGEKGFAIKSGIKFRFYIPTEGLWTDEVLTAPLSEPCLIAFVVENNPTLTSPAQNATYSLSATIPFAWSTSLPDIYIYRIVLIDRNTGNLYEGFTQNKTFLTNMPYAGDWAWQVYAYDADGYQAAYSSVRYLTVDLVRSGQVQAKTKINSNAQTLTRGLNKTDFAVLPESVRPTSASERKHLIVPTKHTHASNDPCALKTIDIANVEPTATVSELSSQESEQMHDAMLELRRKEEQTTSVKPEGVILFEVNDKQMYQKFEETPESPDTEALGENYFDLWDNSDLFKFLINPIIGF